MGTEFHLAVSACSAAFAIGVGVIGPALAMGQIAASALKATHYQPATSGSVTKNMLVGMALTESSAIFALVIAMILLFTPVTSTGWEKLYALAGAGLAIGFGNLGSALGKGLIAAKAIEGMGRNPESEPILSRMMMLTQAITDSPSIFALVVALSLVFIDLPKSGIAYALSLLSAGLCVGIGAAGPSWGEGYAASYACEAVGKKPSSFPIVLRTLLLSMALVESHAVYALVVSLCVMYLS